LALADVAVNFQNPKLMLQGSCCAYSPLPVTVSATDQSGALFKAGTAKGSRHCCAGGCNSAAEGGWYGAWPAAAGK